MSEEPPTIGDLKKFFADVTVLKVVLGVGEDYDSHMKGLKEAIQRHYTPPEFEALSDVTPLPEDVQAEYIAFRKYAKADPSDSTE